MHNFDPLVVLRDEGATLQVYGAEWDTRSDGTSSLMVAQAYAIDTDREEGAVFAGPDGIMWVLRQPLSEGFYIDGIILEETKEEHSATE